MEFKDNLKFVMESKGIQYKELSKITGISENTLKSYLKENSSEPTLSKALKISKALNISLEFLVTGQDSKNSLETNLQIFNIIQKLHNMNSNQVKLVEMYTDLIVKK